MKFYDAFSGIGGFHKGIKQAHPDWECSGACEINPNAASVYKKHFNEVNIDGDIRKVDRLPEGTDILCGGFPCQSFSIAGKRGGFDDTRGTLFFELARLAKASRPRLLFLENVKGLLNHDEGKTMQTICEVLNNLGYIIQLELYNSKDFGVPQNRERVFLICTQITTITNVGQTGKMTSSEKTIQFWLFQLLLNNLKEVKELQERESKDSILGLLILKEIASGLHKKSRLSKATQIYLSKKFPKDFQTEDTLQSTLNQENWGSEKKQGKDTVSILTEENLSTLNMENLWRSIEMLLKETWEESYLGENRYTTSTAIKLIIEWKTFSYFQMLLSMLTLATHLRNSQKNLWKEILSDLIIRQGGTKYARLNDKSKKELEQSSNHPDEHNKHRNRERVFIIGHLGGKRGCEIFPLGEGDGVPDEAHEKPENNFSALTATDYKGVSKQRSNCVAVASEGTDQQDGNKQGYSVATDGDGINLAFAANRKNGRGRVLKGRRPALQTQGAIGTIVRLDKNIHYQDRVYSSEGLAPSLPTMATGGNLHPKILHQSMSGQITESECAGTQRSGASNNYQTVVPVLTPDRMEKRQNGRRFKTDGEPMFTLNTQDQHGVPLHAGAELRIRRLTPRECEKLQGFPVDWTKYYADGTEVSDSQRYRMLGNAVTVNVIRAIAEALTPPSPTVTGK